MDKLKKNAFWVAIAIAVAALVGVFAGLVLPLQAKVEKKGLELGKTLGELKKSERTADDILNKYDALKSDMIKSYGKITGFYEASDRHFERWFPGLGDDPPRGAFQAKYDAAIQELETELKAKGTVVGIPDDQGENLILGFNWENPTPPIWGQINAGGPGEEKRVLKEIQKRFWARQRVANIVLKGGVKVSRVVDFRFFRRLSDRVQQPPWETVPQGVNAVIYPGVKADGGIARGFHEYDLPNELGRTLSFGFTLALPYSEVPKVLKEILNPDIEPRGESGADRLLVNLLGAQVTIREQNAPMVTFNHFVDDLKDKAEKTAKAMEGIKAKDVRMSVTCQIIDFEPSKIAKLSPEAPPPAEPPAK